MVKSNTRIFIRVVHPKPIYLPGTWIEGIVQVCTKGNLQARAIRLKFFGLEFTRWSSGSGENRNKYSQHHDLWTSCLTLWGYPKGDGFETARIKTGSYAFPFRVQIPADESLPAYGKYEKGKVRYGLHAFIDVPLSKNIFTNYHFAVVPRVPRNPSNLQPNSAVEFDTEHKVGCCIFSCCACFGSLNVSARCLNPVVASGQQIYSVAKIENHSSVSVVAVQISLVNRIRFRAEGYYTDTVVPIARTKYPIRIAKGAVFSNLECAVPERDEATAVSDKDNLLGIKSGRHPFMITVPPGLPYTFSGTLIESSLELMFRVSFGNLCSRDARLPLNVAVAPVTELEVAGVGNAPSYKIPAVPPASEEYTPVYLEPASTGAYQVYFSFDGMDYRITEQFEKGKVVSYPCFYDSRPDVIPSSLDAFNASWIPLLTGHSK